MRAATRLGQKKWRNRAGWRRGREGAGHAGRRKDWTGHGGGRAGARERVASRMEELARREGRRLERDMRDVGGVDRLREQWQWRFSLAGECEQLVLFDHGERGEALTRK